MWCKNNGIPTSTFDYWKAKFTNKVPVKDINNTDDSTEVVVAALPIIQEEQQVNNTASIIININQAKIEINVRTKRCF